MEEFKFAANKNIKNTSQIYKNENKVALCEIIF